MDDAGRAGAVGGDIAPVELREVPNGDDADGLEKSEVGGSRDGRSGSDPSIDDIDMLVPGRLIDPKP